MTIQIPINRSQSYNHDNSDGEYGYSPHRRGRSNNNNHYFLTFIIVILTISGILYSMYLDTLVAFKLYIGHHDESDENVHDLNFFYSDKLLTQSEPNTHLSHILPKSNSKHMKIPTPFANLINDNSNSNHSNNITTVLQPSLGQHRYDQDAIFTICDGLSFQQIALFIISLRTSGFKGDIVISTWSKRYFDYLQHQQEHGVSNNNMNGTSDNDDDDKHNYNGLWNFLKYHSNNGLVVYDGVIIADKKESTKTNNFDDDNIVVVDDDGDDDDDDDDEKIKQQHIHLHEMNHTRVWLRGLYGKRKIQTHSSHDNNEKDYEYMVFNDPRISRTIGIARFELFWTWAQRYHPQSKILLIDLNDSNFPIGIGTGKSCEMSAPTTLHLYEKREYNNKLGSIQHRAYLINAYKDKRIMWFLHNQNALSPASVHGPQKAIEAYLRAMVQQFDETKCASFQCEWAFHNYIYNFGIIAGMEEIDYIEKHSWGTTAIKPNTLNVQRPIETSQFNPSTIHQLNRDPVLKQKFNELLDSMINHNTDPTSKLFESSSSFLFANDTSSILSQPTLGKHRPDQNAIFSFASGVYDDLAMFILSARKSGFKGDIVINIPKRTQLEEKVMKFLDIQSKHGVVVYEGYDISLIEGEYKFILDRNDVAFEVARFEYFYIWSHHYPDKEIMIIDGEYSYFQTNPFAAPTDCGQMALNFYEENYHTINFDFMYIDHKDIWKTILGIFQIDDDGEMVFRQEISCNSVLNPSSIVGHQHALKRFLFNLIDLFDASECTYYGCDYACVNYLFYKEIQKIGNPISFSVSSRQQGGHFINTGFAASLHYLSQNKIYDLNSNLFLNSDGQPTPVVLNYHLYKEVEWLFDKRLEDLLKEIE